MAKWRASRKFSLEFVPLLLLLLWKSFVSVRPVAGRWEYFRAVVLSAAATLVHRRIVLPTERLRSDVVVEYRGLRYLVTRDVVFGYYLLPFEPYTFRKLLECHGEVFVDLGASVGQYTIPLARRFQKVLAVEPNPVAARVLRQNIDLNRLTNVTVIEKAVAEGPGPIRLFSGEFLTSSSTKLTGEEFVWVDTVTLAALLEGIPRVDLMKIDVEGAERDILFGERGVLSKVRVLSLETNLDSSPEPTFELLRESGFEVEVLGGLLRDRENLHAVRPS